MYAPDLQIRCLPILGGVPVVSSRHLLVAVLTGVGLTALSGRAQTPDVNREAALRFFENRVRPQLAEHCYECHGPEREESGLRLDTYAGIFEGGDTGLAVVPGEPDESLMLVALSYQNEELEMPPDGKLPDRIVADLRRWIELGAPHPDKGRPQDEPSETRPQADGERLWSFVRPRRERLPAIRQMYASPSSAGGHVYFAGRDGNVVVIKDADQFEVVAWNQIGEPVDASPVIAGNELFIRGRKHLFCIAEDKRD